MAYVDLNPIRAKIADTSENSVHTSVKKRIEKARKGEQPKQLYPFVGNPRKDMPDGLPFSLADYLALVDMTGRVIREDKRGAIDATTSPILERLNIDHQCWLELTTGLEKHFGGVVGRDTSLLRYKVCHHQQRVQGMGAAKRWLTQ
ncbi:hypothetical protein [Aliagarivorans marinus]|uniref:hypothetical protein n=1 Tax=Aliagarivorans marinus TaxID=561965 RepID=UPI000400191B|nr:hypothetical protein [Aliagarivorans marinus]